MPALLASLHSDQASLVLELRDAGAPVWRHLGARLDPGALAPLGDGRTAASFSLNGDVPLCTAPVAGFGWFGPVALAARRDGRALMIDFTVSAVKADADAITIRLEDPQEGLLLEQRVTRDPGGAFRFDARLTNRGAAALTLDWLASAQIPLAADSTGLISWRGRHNAELAECREAMPQQVWAREGRRGISGHGGPPGVVVLGEGAGHHSGLVHALQLAWSGDSRLTVERDDEGFWLLSAGAALQPGEVVLQHGESYTAPQAILAASTQGRGGAAAQHHAAVRAQIGWPGGAMRPRPVHLNSWEACYFDHDEARIADLAQAAAAIGIERFVLDDGWFKGRDDDTAGLGDWICDPVKYPHGLKPLADKVCALGMEFGLWVEPEMVNPDSDLTRAHPEWALHVPGRAQPTARGQLVLNMALPQVRDYLFGALDTLLREVAISYLKWDHNRDLAPAGGAAQMAGTYDLLGRLRAAHPLVEIEGCAGGGGRSDAGLASYVHRFWTSDNIDAVSRVAMQRGFLAFLPPELMGAHIGASPAHATGRTQALGFRAAVAMPGHFGVELDPRKLDEADRAELADWIAFHKAWRHLLHGTRTWQGEGADGLVWQAAGTAREFLLFVIRADPPHDRRPQPLRLPFLAEADDVALQLLRIGGSRRGYAMHSAALFDAMRAAPQRFTGSWLAQAGLQLPPLKAESVAIFHGVAR
ncbi:alpha-galactosidase [Novosphingobium sp.]|uniref:alpha-galactosidase n=1 Tax=Novosphingobium sp. TaxID=1874826 RepID=UPI00286AC384|nr:alpha-galactosidase [Novosphingobium sp.]